jgi:hypothetical protein
MAHSPSVTSHRARRAIASGSPILLASGLALAGFVANNIGKGFSLSNVLVLLVLVLTILLLAFQMRAEYRRRTYDPTWLVRFTDEFHGEEMESIRCEASKFLKMNAAQPAGEASSELSKLFDFFDQVGFLLQGDQISAESAHHAFHHWIRGYWPVARDYISTAQAKEGSSLWEFVEVVFDMTTQIERQRSKNPSTELTKEQIQEFLNEEIESTCGPHDDGDGDSECSRVI